MAEETYTHSQLLASVAQTYKQAVEDIIFSLESNSINVPDEFKRKVVNPITNLPVFEEQTPETAQVSSEPTVTDIKESSIGE